MNNAQRIAEIITDLIESQKGERNISINKMLLDCGLNTGLVRDMKKGQMPAADKLAKIANYLRVDINYLLDNTVQLSNIVNPFPNTEFTKSGKNTADYLLIGTEDNIENEKVNTIMINPFLDVNLNEEMLKNLEECIPLFHVFDKFPESDVNTDQEKQLFARYKQKLNTLCISQDDIHNFYAFTFKPSPYLLTELMSFYKEEKLDWFDKEIIINIERNINFYEARVKLAKEDNRVNKLEKENKILKAKENEEFGEDMGSKSSGGGKKYS